MLQWKKIVERWHLTYEDIPICRLSKALEEQTETKICPSCVDSLSGALARWQQVKKGLSQD